MAIIKKTFGLLMILSVFSACSNDSPFEEVPLNNTFPLQTLSFNAVSSQNVRLESVSSCDALNDKMRKLAITKLERAWADLNDEENSSTYANFFVGRDFSPIGGGMLDGDGTAEVDVAAESTANLNYTQQNSQIVGILEPDTVFTNGSLIFALSNNEVKIYRAWPVNELAELSVINSETSLGNYNIYVIDRILLHNDHLVIFGAVTNDNNEYFAAQITFDLADPQNPSPRTAQFIKNAYWQNARIKGDRLVSLFVKETEFSVNYYPTHTSPGSIMIASDDGLSYRRSISDHITAETDRINTLTAEDILPEIITINFANATENTSAIECDQVMTNDFTLGNQMTIVLNDNLNSEDDTLEPMGVLGYTSQIYMNDQSLILQSGVNGLFYQLLDESEVGFEEQNANASAITASVLHRFELNGEGTIYHASGAVPGTVPSSWAIDNDGEVTRVATHVFLANSGLTSEPIDVQLNILQENDDELQNVGEIHNLVADEEIFAVRYVEDRVYLVTYQVSINFDPLFVIDISDNTNPRLLGQLEMSGFSSYLELLDENVLLGIGQTDTSCWFSSSNCIGQDYKVSLFSVADESLPTEISQSVIDIAFAESHINHLGVHVDHETNKLFLPVYQGYNSETSLNEYQIALFDLNNNTVTQLTPLDVDTNTTGNVLRTLLISDENTDPILYIVGTDGIQTATEF